METRVCCLHSKGDIQIETHAVAAPGPGEVLVAIGAAGICGSDLHYFQNGGFGTIRVREPMILGHEAAGTVIAIGEGVDNVEPGTRVAVNPSNPCNDCVYCNQGMPIHCLNMRFSGSAMRFPHEQGLFRDRIVVEAARCVPVKDGPSLSEAACSEPLAVCLHARSVAGELTGKRVLVTGAGPIGALCAGLAKDGGASEVVVTDLQDFPLEVAAKMGATRTINIVNAADAMEPYMADKGYFDVVFECSAAAPALKTALMALRPRGTLVQVGIAGDQPIPINLVVSKEISIKGTQRFHSEFAEAVEMISQGRINVRPIVTQTCKMTDAESAFVLAADRTKAVKVHLTFAGEGT